MEPINILLLSIPRRYRSPPQQHPPNIRRPTNIRLQPSIHPKIQILKRLRSQQHNPNLRSPRCKTPYIEISEKLATEIVKDTRYYKKEHFAKALQRASNEGQTDVYIL
jgi:hypothetical protein